MVALGSASYSTAVTAGLGSNPTSLTLSMCLCRTIGQVYIKDYVMVGIQKL